MPWYADPMITAAVILKAAFHHCGYGIIARLTPADLEERIPGVNLGVAGHAWEQPLRVIAEATREEWNEQCRLVPEMGTRLDAAYKYFYRVIPVE